MPMRSPRTLRGQRSCYKHGRHPPLQSIPCLGLPYGAPHKSNEVDFDFLPEGGGEPHGYEEFMASVDVLIIDRTTFEKVLTFETWPYGKARRCSEQPRY
jgi:hypothetical protein